MLDDMTRDPLDAPAAYEAARQARAEAAVGLREADAALGRGNAALADAEAVLRGLDGVKAEVAKHRATAIREGGKASAALPPKLHAHRAEMFEAERMLTEVQAACDQLAREQEEAARVLAQADARLRVAARGMLAHEVGLVADQLEELDRQAEPLRQALAEFVGSFMRDGPVEGGLDSLRPDVMPRKIIIRVQQLLADPARPRRVGFEERERFRGRLIELMRR